jgi:hypothetical protein
MFDLEAKSHAVGGLRMRDDPSVFKLGSRRLLPCTERRTLHSITKAEDTAFMKAKSQPFVQQQVCL